MTNLHSLSAGENQFTAIPTEIGKLQNLEELNLIGSLLSKAEQEKIVKLLPKTKITFNAPE
jgi:Leucine-rich repeat (LRR) protein